MAARVLAGSWPLLSPEHHGCVGGRTVSQPEWGNLAA